MNPTPSCPRCQAPLATTSTPGGLCARCLLQTVRGRSGSLPDVDETAGIPQPPLPAELAEHFPGLVIEECIGQGGMGAVYRVQQKGLERTAALKILHAHVAQRPGFAERFAHEARTLASLHHENLVGVHEFGQAGPWYYFVMEFVDGVDLRALMGSGSPSARESLRIVGQICDALQYAHDQGVVHRDIKPENILVDRNGLVRILDFGLAKLVGSRAVEPALSRVSQVMGTPHYMAPEQWERPREVDHRADIYSLGVVFYELLTGELPVGRFDPPSKRVEIDVRLDEVVLRTLERQPERRYQHASEIKTEITKVTLVPPAEPSTPAASTTLRSQSPLLELFAPGPPRSHPKRQLSRGFVCFLVFACLLAALSVSLMVMQFADLSGSAGEVIYPANPLPYPTFFSTPIQHP